MKSKLMLDLAINESFHRTVYVYRMHRETKDQTISLYDLVESLNNFLSITKHFYYFLIMLIDVTKIYKKRCTMKSRKPRCKGRRRNWKR